MPVRTDKVFANHMKQLSRGTWCVRHEQFLLPAELCLRGGQRWGRARAVTRPQSRPKAAFTLLPLRLSATVIGMSAATALAQAAPDLQLPSLNEHQGAIGISVVVSLALITCVTALLHLTGRNKWTLREARLQAEAADASARLERSTVFLSAERQIIIAWGAAASEPDIEGDMSLVTDAPIARRVLGFGSWLTPVLAQQMDAKVEKLRSRGESFMLPLLALNGRRLEAEGRAIAGRAILRIRDVSGDRLELTLLRERHAKMNAELDTFKALMEAIPDPVWLRDAQDRIAWVNGAYVKAVEARDGAEAVERGLELMDQSARAAAREALQKDSVWRASQRATYSNARRLVDFTEANGRDARIGMARDQSELEAARVSLERQMQAHSKMLDQLPTAVATFDANRRLVFHNAAYRALWSLDERYLSQMPLDDEILDRLRAARRLPEEADFRAWRNQLFATYRSVESTTAEHLWYLPDGRTLHVVANPNGQNGVTYLFDDVSESARLRSQFTAMTAVQGETLDNLREGVAVFGTNGRLKLSNPALAAMWRIDPARLTGALHIDEFTSACGLLYADAEKWQDLRQAVAGFTDARTGLQFEMVRRDGMIIECAAVPLPDGATLITFTDITASFNVEKALKDRNEALTQAEKLRDDFVHHVSYELRTPLNSIIGFTQMLADEIAGPLNARQKEYANDVSRSSTALLAIIDQILDLASIDRGALDLNVSEVNIAEVIESAADGVRDRIAERALNLSIVVLDDAGTFRADAKRLRQILFALLSNAIGFSEAGQTVALAAMRREDTVVFKVSDQGRGISPELKDQVWERFRTFPQGSRHRGAGLGLSIVRALVEEHHGTVDIQSALGEGTVVTCVFPAPAAPAAALPAAVNKD